MVLSLPQLGEDLLDNVAVDVREAAVGAVVTEGELLVVEAEEVQDGGVDVVALGEVRTVGGLEAPFVALAVGDAAFDPAAGQGIVRPDAPLREGVPGLRIEARPYPEHGATEWQFRLRAPASGESPIFENLQSADFEVAFPSGAPVTLHWSKGSHSEPGDFEPKTETLSAGKTFSLESFGGRSSDGVMPYFNLSSAGGGLIVAIGWTGDWKATFTLENDGKVRVVAGLKRTRFRLAPGEEVRLPSIVAMNYRGDQMAGQNQFQIGRAHV